MKHIIDTDELEKLPRYEQDKFLVRYEDVVKLIANSPQVPDTVPRAKYDKLLEALKTLVELKHQKDTLGKVPTYMDAMPIAWNIARQAIAEAESTRGS